jgi:hypothetical protein
MYADGRERWNATATRSNSITKGGLEIITPPAVRLPAAIR